MNLYDLAFNAVSVLEEQITVVRRQQISNANTRLGQVTQTFTAWATVVASGPDDLERDAAYSNMKRSIEVSTSFALQGPTQNGQALYQPDQVIWHGTTFIVTHVKDYSKDGAGFITATCESQTPTDPPTMLP